MLMRIDKVLSQLKIATRSESRKLFAAGRVMVNRETVKNGSFRFDPEKDQLYVDGNPVSYEPYQYWMLYKPAGCITATEDAKEQTVMQFLPPLRHRDLSPVGRLDKDTEGLLLITDDGALNHALLAPGKHVEKEYFARVRGLVTEATVRQFAQGLEIGEKRPTAPAVLEAVSSHPDAGEGWCEVRVTVTEGKFHQVKRMFQAVGMQVLYLKRLRMGTLVLDEQLKPGECRLLTEEEIRRLKSDHGK